MPRRSDISQIHESALTACRRASVWAYRNNYAGGAQTICRRQPDDRHIYLTGLRSFDYAKEVGCSTRTALTHLRRLVVRGLFSEDKNPGGCSKFRPAREQAIIIGEQIIADLVKQGLPFDDDWRAGQARAGGAS